MVIDKYSLCTISAETFNWTSLTLLSRSYSSVFSISLPLFLFSNCWQAKQLRKVSELISWGLFSLAFYRPHSRQSKLISLSPFLSAFLSLSSSLTFSSTSHPVSSFLIAPHQNIYDRFYEISIVVSSTSFSTVHFPSLSRCLPLSCNSSSFLLTATITLIFPPDFPQSLAW